MIRVTIWYEYVQESGELPESFLPAGTPEEHRENFRKFIANSAAAIKKVYPKGVMGTVAEHLSGCEDMQVTSVNLFMPEYGLTDELLEHTDVLIWWAHIAHDAVPDELVRKIRDRVLKGMGFIPLHSAHPSKPMQALLGTSGSLKWRAISAGSETSIPPIRLPRGFRRVSNCPRRRCTESLSISRSRTISCSWGGLGAGRYSAAAVPGPGDMAKSSISSRATRPAPPTTIR